MLNDKLLEVLSHPADGIVDVEGNNRVKLTIGSREVQGTMYKGTGFLIIRNRKIYERGFRL